MANLGGFQMKSVKYFPGMENDGMSANLYLYGKKIGTYIDYGDGGMENVEFVSETAETAMKHFIVDFAKSHENPFIEKLFKERPKQWEDEVKNFKKNFPFVKDEDITYRVVASDSIVYAVSEFEKLLSAEKTFKSAQKRGYGSIATDGYHITQYPQSWSKERVLADVEQKNAQNATRIAGGNADQYVAYFSLDDFEISHEEMMKDAERPVLEQEEEMER